MDLLEQLKSYSPWNEQEQHDLAEIIRWLENSPDVYVRENLAAHMTASSWVVSPDRKKVLMIYHNLYDSWAWMGGHADGDKDLFRVALRETMEESGLTTLNPGKDELFSVEILTVDGHIKRGSYVPSHLHLNVTYLIEADPSAPLKIKPDENSGVAWFYVEDIPQKVSEPWMMKWIYQKLIDKTARSGGPK